MSALALSCLIFVLTLGGILLGALLRRALPEHHLSEDSQDVVRLGVGLIATIAALVLGLLIASAKSSFDTQSTQITQITADIILLDNLLAEYGPEARPIREQMRSIIGPLADRLWREKQASTATPFELSGSSEKAYLGIQSLSPQNDLQRSLQARAAQVSTDLVQTRLILFAEFSQRDSNTVSRHLGALDRHHICKLQSVLGFECDGFRLPIALCAVGVVRDFSDFGT